MKIGIFDSGYGGLTILESIRSTLPDYDYIYLGDNARTPYGTRSFEVVYRYTWEAVRYLFDHDCALVILACNTASAKALRSIQQNELLQYCPDRRVLGVIRPTAEMIGSVTQSRHVGILATEGTIASRSYVLEIEKLFPDITVHGKACPMWVPLIENNEHHTTGADYFVRKYIDDLFAVNSSIDTIILGCTHYPLLYNTIAKAVPDGVKIVCQGDIVAQSLADYLHRHTEIEEKCTKNGTIQFLTTEQEDKFSRSASIFLNHNVNAQHITL